MTQSVRKSSYSQRRKHDLWLHTKYGFRLNQTKIYSSYIYLSSTPLLFSSFSPSSPLSFFNLLPSLPLPPSNKHASLSFFSHRVPHRNRLFLNWQNFLKLLTQTKFNSKCSFFQETLCSDNLSLGRSSVEWIASAVNWIHNRVQQGSNVVWSQNLYFSISIVLNFHISHKGTL